MYSCSIFFFAATHFRKRYVCEKLKVTMRDAKEDVDKVCIDVRKTSDNAGGKRTSGISLQHKTFI